MPYKKRYQKRRFQRKPYMSKTKKLVTGKGPTLLQKIGSYAGPVATLAKAIMPVVAAINTEQKFLDINSTGAPTLAAPVIFNMSALAQGTDEQNRIGNSILAKNLSINATISTSWSGAAADSVANGRWRVIVFSDKSQAGTPPVLADIVQNTSLFNSRLNKNNSDRFVVIKDKIIPMNRDADQLTNGYVKTMQIKVFKQLDFHIRYIGTSAANASMGQNQLYVMYWYTGGTANITGAVSSYSRLNFTDN